MIAQRLLPVVCLFFGAQGMSQSSAGAQTVFPSDQGIEVEARGPIHEAFARPSTLNAEAGPVAPRQPPPPIPEEPPDQKPDSDSVQWIPGYWSWDEDRNDFIWVSGLWRAAPPDRKWVQGRWVQTNDGWQWSTGYWAGLNMAETPLRQPPPASLDIGPAAPAPNSDSFYVPGNWVAGDSGYIWRPGYWQPCRADWVWNNSYYSWTPAGYVCVNGYWDYPLANRGLPFAPVCFERPWWRTPGWVFRPHFTLALDGLMASLWVRPGWGHYFFGDYYEARYTRFGFHPWHTYGARFHDPLFSYYQWRHRGDPG